MPLAPPLSGLPLSKVTFLQGASERSGEDKAMARWSVELALSQGWSVWWVDTNNDLEQEHLWLAGALERDLPVARLAVHDRNQLNGHQFLAFDHQPPQDTLGWWTHLLRETMEREPTSEELESWAHRREAPTSPSSENPSFANTNPNVQAETYWQNEATALGHVIPEVFLGQQHQLWVADHPTGFRTPRTQAWLGWLLEQHAQLKDAPPVWIVFHGGNLEPVTRYKAWDALEVGRRQLLYVSAFPLLNAHTPTFKGLPPYLQWIDRAWNVRFNRTKTHLLGHAFGTGHSEHWRVPVLPEQPLKQVKWPMSAPWKALVKHARLVQRFGQEKPGPGPGRSRSQRL